MFGLTNFKAVLSAIRGERRKTKMKTIEINGRTFEIKKVKADRLSAMERNVKRYAGFDLDNYYAKRVAVKSTHLVRLYSPPVC